MNKQKNNKLSVTASDEPMSSSAHNVNELLFSISCINANIGKDIAKIGDMLATLSDLGVKLDKIGGALPYCLKASFTGFNAIDREMSDELFINGIIRIEKENPDPVQAALAFGSLSKKIIIEIEKCKHRVEKLIERTRNQKHGPEFETAAKMKRANRDFIIILERRLGFTLGKFFASRNRSIEAITRITSAVYDLFPNGSPIVRTAYLENSTDSLGKFKTLDERLKLGESKHGRVTVKI